MRKYIFLLAFFVFVSNKLNAQQPIWDDALGEPSSGSYLVSSSSGQLRIAQTTPYSPDTDWSIIADNLDMGFRSTGQDWIRITSIIPNGAYSVNIYINYSENTSTSNRTAFLGTRAKNIEIVQSANSPSPPSPDPGDKPEEDYPEFGNNPQSPDIPLMPLISDNLSLPKTKNWIISESLSDTCSVREITYYDGLGFPRQQTLINYSSNISDLITLYDYDIYGNVVRKYLPYEREQNSGNYDNSDSLSQIDYYSSLYGQNEGKFAYLESQYENRVNGKILKHQMPGNELAKHPTTVNYITNAIDTIEIVDVNAVSGEAGIIGNYPLGSLFGIKAIDGDNRSTTTWIDNNDRVVCVDTGNSGTKCRTLYGYDFRGNLCWVISPEGYARLSETSKKIAITDNFAHSYCWRYRYDSRNHLTAKYMPGAGVQLFVYDPAGKLLLQQNSLMREKNKWLCVNYDVAGRITSENIVNDTTGIDWETVLPELNCSQLDSLYAAGAKTPLCVYKYDMISDTLAEELNFLSIPSIIPIDSLNLDMRGLLTYKLVSTTYGEPYAEKVYYYDRKGNIAQIVEKRPYGYLRSSFRYDLQKRVTAAMYEYIEPGDNIDDIYLSKYTYNIEGKIQKEITSLNGHTVIIEYTYDSRGRLVGKKYSGNGFGGNSPNEIFSYNLQGWEIEHKSQLNSNDIVFSSNLTYYENSQSNPCYTGNISSWKYLSADNIERTYVYKYDSLNRLIDSQEYVSDTLENKNIEYDIQYDHNGNILSMIRANGGILDTLKYSYLGNQRTCCNYDSNGNMITDDHYYVTAEYDVFNHPSNMFGGGDYASDYYYLADGTKAYSVMDETYYENYYVGPFIYTSLSSHVLRGAKFSNGIIYRGYNDDYSTVIYIRDHVGSTRVKIKNGSEVVGKYDYLPYGDVISRSSSLGYVNDWYFSGKELEISNDIFWYDSGARYQTADGIFTSIDPLAENYYSLSPYLYCAGNPINLVDPQGESWFYNYDSGEFVTHLDDDNDSIYLLTQEQLNGIKNKSDYKKFMTLEHSFGQILIEGFDKYTEEEAMSLQNTIINVLTDLVNRTNKIQEDSETNITQIDNIIVTFLKTDKKGNKPYASANQKTRTLTIYALNGNYFKGYGSMLIFAHEIGHLIDPNIKDKEGRELRADEFARRHWAFPKASAKMIDILNRHAYENK